MRACSELRRACVLAMRACTAAGPIVNSSLDAGAYIPKKIPVLVIDRVPFCVLNGPHADDTWDEVEV